MSVSTAKADAELFIRRTFDAPRERVFRMWTEAEHLRRWCCPTGFVVTFSEGDVRPGGRFRSCMRSPEGVEHWVAGTYVEIVPGERIAFTHAWEDGQGSPGHETLVTVILADEGRGRTRLTLHQAFFESAASRDGHAIGWNATLDQLEGYLVR